MSGVGLPDVLLTVGRPRIGGPRPWGRAAGARLRRGVADGP
ncbi:hypothetical protein ABT039_35020 [Streptomyces lasiicapitis]